MIFKAVPTTAMMVVMIPTTVATILSMTIKLFENIICRLKFQILIVVDAAVKRHMMDATEYWTMGVVIVRYHWCWHGGAFEP